ncbi:MAG: hypothetical protein ACJAQT_001633 [Akkermansiaceae bacterium]|jgi:hypothetical protein
MPPKRFDVSIEIIAKDPDHIRTIRSQKGDREK